MFWARRFGFLLACIVWACRLRRAPGFFILGLVSVLQQVFERRQRPGDNSDLIGKQPFGEKD